MAENTKIEWCDHTVNLWWGCTKVHKGCDNCYAEALSHRFGDNIWGNDNPRKEIKSAFKDLDKYQRKAEKDGVNRTVFVGSMMDIFEKPMPLIDHKGNPNKSSNTGNLRFHLLYRIDRGDYPNLIFLFLTKRPSNINKYIFESWKKDGAPKNVWFGTSPVDQKTFDTLVPQLLKIKGNRFLSIEPQLGPIDNLSPIFDDNDLLTDIQWVIQGGESGPNRRPFDLKWARCMRTWCLIDHIPYFFKQIDKVKPIPEKYLVREFPEW